MDKKGFTLFTALVSFVLILLSAMLVQTMIKAERDRTEVISNIQEQAEMQAMADLTRAEALQTFNYIIRKDIEKFFDYNQRENTIEIDPQDKNFNEIKEDFARRFFGAGDDRGRQFVNQMSTTLINSLPQTKFVGPYIISIKNTEQEILKGSLQAMFKKSVEEGEFFEVVKCENGNPKDCKGTFYLNLKLADLDDKTYESFPQIKVYNPRTGRVLQESIFPKADLRLYVPIRLFKAIAEARALALEYNKEQGNSWGQNYGLFSPRIHNEIEEMKLGMCDPGYCNPRTNPYVPPEEKNMIGRACPNYPGFEYDIRLNCTQDLRLRGICTTIGQPISAQLSSYDPNTATVSSDSQEKALNILAGKRMCAIANLNVGQGKFLDPYPDDSFVLEDDSELGGTFELSCSITEGTGNGKISFSFDSTTRNSVKINSKTRDIFEGGPEQITGFTGNYNANRNYGSQSSPCPMTLNTWGTAGISIVNGKITETESGSLCPDISLSDIPLGNTPMRGTCSEISSVSVRIPFKETDQNYIINKKDADGNPKNPIYVVMIVDNQFSPKSNEKPFHQAIKFSSDTTTCALNENRESNQQCSLRDWTCNSYGPADQAPGEEGTSGSCEVPE